MTNDETRPSYGYLAEARSAIEQAKAETPAPKEGPEGAGWDALRHLIFAVDNLVGQAEQEWRQLQSTSPYPPESTTEQA